MLKSLKEKAKSKGQDSINHMVEELNEFRPVIQKLGFDIAELVVSVSIPPSKFKKKLN